MCKNNSAIVNNRSDGAAIKRPFIVMIFHNHKKPVKSFTILFIPDRALNLFGSNCDTLLTLRYNFLKAIQEVLNKPSHRYAEPVLISTLKWD